jgi:RNA polymerase sigma-70 factor (ECF subfamily)
LHIVNARGPTVVLVTSTGSREPAVLVYRSAGIDETAFGALFDVTAPRVYGLAMRIDGARGRAEETARDPYLEVWRTSTSFDSDRTSAMAWIKAIAHRRAMDRVRAAHDAKQPPPGAPVTPLVRRRAARSGRRSGRPLSTERHQVHEAVRRLTPAERDTLELAYFDGYARTEPADLNAILATLVNLTATDPRRG